MKFAMFVVCLFIGLIAGISVEANELRGLQIEKNATQNGIFAGYQLSEKKLNWYEALYLCASQGMNLLSILNSSQDLDVKNFLEATGWFSAWTAGNNLEGKFIWQTSGKIISDFNWRSGSPGLKPGCISVANTGACGRSGDYGWAREDCDVLHYAVCQS